MLVTAIEASPVRSLDQVRVELQPGIVSVVGPNGIGKTNLVEALYFALTGRSFRTSDRRDLIPFGASLARAEATVRDDDGLERRLLASVSRTEGTAPPARRRPGRPGDARAQPPTGRRLRPGPPEPDQGTAVGAPRPPRRLRGCALASAGGAAQALRPGAGAAQRDALAARRPALARRPNWTSGTPAWPMPPRRWSPPARRRSPSCSTPFASAAADLGLEGGASLEYAPRAAGSAEEIRAGLEERRDQDVRMGRSSWGPHLDELKFSTAGRSLRRYGSQGQQRAALLALLFAEREVLLAARRVTPLLLLDDVMSELDPGRRERLVRRLDDGGQTLITAADEESLPPAALTSVVRMPPPALPTRRRGMSRPPRPPPGVGRDPRRPRPRRAQNRPGGGAGGLGGSGRRAARRGRDAGLRALRNADDRVRRHGLGTGAGPDAGAAAGASDGPSWGTRLRQLCGSV